MKWFTAFGLSVVLIVGVCTAQTQQGNSPAAAKSKSKRHASKTSEDSVTARLNALQQQVDAQQAALRQMNQQVQSRDEKIQQLEQRLDQSQAAVSQAQAKAETATAQSTEQQETVTALKSDVSDLKSNATGVALTLQDTQKNLQASIDSPLALHFKGINITPGGFLAAETVYRQHGLGADVNTPLNSIPFSGAAQSHLSEFYGSGRQSRISMLAEGALSDAKLSGYVEADFLSAGVTSNNNQSNSYSLRQRQAWGQAALANGWTFTGGQMWSLVTETKKGLDNRSEALPMTIDAQYTAGFSWARQYGFRVTKNFGNKVWLGASVENPQTTLGGHGASNNFVLGSQGSGGGLYNGTANYSFNAIPDFVFKAAFEPGWGHYEVFGVLSKFRDRIYPCATNLTGVCGGLNGPSTTGVFNNSELAGGLGVNLRGTVAKKFDIGVHFLGGQGIGRYGTSGLPDALARPDGSLVPLRNYQTLGTLEFHAKRLDIYSNVGSEYEARQWYNGGNIGYGSPLANNSGCGTETIPVLTSTPVQTPPPPGGTTPGSGSVPVVGSTGTPLSGGFNPGGLKNCNGDTRNLLEGTLGFWYRFYSGPKGRVQWGPQYSYIVRNIWRGTGSDPSAKEGMFLTSFRYYLP